MVAVVQGKRGSNAEGFLLLLSHRCCHPKAFGGGKDDPSLSPQALATTVLRCLQQKAVCGGPLVCLACCCLDADGEKAGPPFLADKNVHRPSLLCAGKDRQGGECFITFTSPTRQCLGCPCDEGTKIFRCSFLLSSLHFSLLIALLPRAPSPSTLKRFDQPLPRVHATTLWIRESSIYAYSVKPAHGRCSSTPPRQRALDVVVPFWIFEPRRSTPQQSRIHQESRQGEQVLQRME